MFTLLILSFVLILLGLFNEKDSTQLELFSQLTTLPDLALSVGYLETRNRFYTQNDRHLFVNMRPISTMDFIYAK